MSMGFWQIFITLFIIMDSVGAVPILISILKGVKPERRIKVLMREMICAYLIMLLFLFSGGKLLNLLGLTQEAIKAGGAVILFIIGIRMIFPSGNGVMGDEDEGGEPLIVPIAMPLIAGPSLLANLILLVGKYPMSLCFTTMTLAWFCSSVVLLSSGFLFRVLGDKGLKALERLMGMILIFMSIQMVFDSIRDFVHTL